MSKEKEITVEEAQKVLVAEEQTRRQEFGEKLQSLLNEYGYDFTARFEIFGTTVNPPIRLINRQNSG